MQTAAWFVWLVWFFFVDRCILVVRCLERSRFICYHNKKKKCILSHIHTTESRQYAVWIFSLMLRLCWTEAMANDSRETINSQCSDGMTWPGMHSIPIFAIYILLIFVVYIKSASKFFSLSLADSFTLIYQTVFHWITFTYLNRKK